MKIKLYQLRKPLRLSIIFFLLALSFGYFSGLNLLNQTTNFNPSGIEQNVIGSEFDENANELFFKMSERELHGIIHSHVISISIILFILTTLFYYSSFTRFKVFLMLEPFISLIVTFGGLWLLWLGYNWIKYVIMVSGMLMHFSILLIIIIIIKELLLGKYSGWFAKS